MLFISLLSGASNSSTAFLIALQSDLYKEQINHAALLIMYNEYSPPFFIPRRSSLSSFPFEPQLR